MKEQLPTTIIAKISQPLLKFSNQQEREIFAQKVLAFINPKYNDGSNQNDVRLDFEVIIDFSRTSDLTANEFLLALQLSADGKLFFEGSDGKSNEVKLFREIDRIKLGEVQKAYIQHKNKDKLHQQGQEKLKAHLNPPKEKSEEELKSERMIFLKGQYQELQTKGSIRASVVFYPLLRKKHKDINLDFVDNFHINFKPESFDKKEGGFSNPIQVTKNDVHTSFQDVFLSAAIKKYKLKEKTEKEWIDFWEELYQLEK